jgi:hypothetical protein
MKISNRFIAVVLLAMMLVVGATWAWAQNGNEVIHACVHKQTGITRIVSDASECNETVEVHKWWNQVGLEGPQGPPGVIRFYTRTFEDTFNPTSQVYMTAYCEEGDVATGGGYYNLAGRINIYREEPVEDLGGVPRAWAVGGQNPDPIERALEVHVVCADMTP